MRARRNAQQKAATARWAARKSLTTCACGGRKHWTSESCKSCRREKRLPGAFAKNGVKTCSACHKSLPVSDFSPYKNAADGFAYRCRKCSTDGLKSWQRTRSGWTSLLRKRYGITADDWDRLYESQGGACASCRSPIKRRACDGRELWIGDGEDPDVDHCHDTGKVRGLLCCWCNMAATRNMTPARLRALADYVERWKP